MINENVAQHLFSNIYYDSWFSYLTAARIYYSPATGFSSSLAKRFSYSPAKRFYDSLAKIFTYSSATGFSYSLAKGIYFSLATRFSLGNCLTISSFLGLAFIFFISFANKSENLVT